MTMAADTFMPWMGLASKRSSKTPAGAGLAGLALAVTDSVMWGVAIRDGYDELDDPAHHRDVTGHAYLKGSDQQAMCGYRPPQRSFFARQRVKLGLPTPGVHGKCEGCTEAMVSSPVRTNDSVAPHRAKVPVSIRSAFAAFH